MGSVSEVIGDGLHTSISQIKTYLTCPRQFELKYVRGANPQFQPRNLVFGTAFHSALARYYLGRQLGESPTPDELVQTFRDAWAARSSTGVPLEPEDPDDPPGSPVDLASRMLAAFHSNAEATQRNHVVLDVELPFAVTLYDPTSGVVQEERLVGVIDLVVHDGDRVVVVEHKTSARRYSADQLQFDLQPTAYRIGMREQGGLHEVGLRYQVITKTKAPAVQIEDVERSAGAETDFRRVALGVLKAIDAGVSYPVRGWQCRSCPYSAACGQER